jgi:hypothetical protein
LPRSKSKEISSNIFLLPRENDKLETEIKVLLLVMRDIKRNR